MANSLEINQLSKSFGYQKVLNEVDAKIYHGETVWIMGPNGAGKTTLLRIVSGGLSPTSGKISLENLIAHPHNPAYQKNIGMVSHQTRLYRHLTILENLRFFGKFYGLFDMDESIENELAYWEIDNIKNRSIDILSRGQKQRAVLARCFVHKPSLLLLDEPFEGLDANIQSLLDKRMKMYQDEEKGIIFFTSHLLVPFSITINRIFVLIKGKKMVERDVNNNSHNEIHDLYTSLVADKK